ncbi:MAG: PRC-barrel domain-containing protein [Thermoleophilia bacterium]|nr:PRC-barrel domain-containing protein [Thermoleophilia bacterium]
MADTDERLVGWVGLDLFDADGKKVGNVTDVRYGKNTGDLVWLIVKTGWFGLKKIAVPASEVDRQGGRAVARGQKGRMKGAPGVSADKILGDEQEEKICTYYGFDFVSSPWKPVEGCLEDETGTAGPGTGGDASGTGS